MSWKAQEATINGLKEELESLRAEAVVQQAIYVPCSIDGLPWLTTIVSSLRYPDIFIQCFSSLSPLLTLTFSFCALLLQLVIYEGPQRRHGSTGQNNIHPAIVATMGTDSEPPASLTSSEHTLLSQNPRLSFFDEEYVAGRCVPFSTLHSDSLESSSEKMPSPEKLEKTSSSEKRPARFLCPRSQPLLRVRVSRASVIPSTTPLRLLPRLMSLKSLWLMKKILSYSRIENPRAMPQKRYALIPPSTCLEKGIQLTTND